MRDLRHAADYYDAGYWTEVNGGGWVWRVGGRVTHWREIVAHPESETWICEPRNVTRDGQYLLDLELAGTL